ncbi:MAG TPA: aminotransferase class IV [Candidatus Saccharimonadales bacterium]|nr:aminotransferase class IV [Candidatus Saccharimonadales bacterium]
MNFTHFSKNGELLPLTEALIPLNDIRLQYGFGVYESLRVRNNIIYFVKEHTDRLFESARLIDLPHPYSKEDIARFLIELVEKNKTESCNIKVLLIGGATAEESLLFIFLLAPLFPDRKLYTYGATTETFHYERFMPNAKTLNMLPSYLAYSKAKKNHHYDALFIDRDETIIEGTRTNFFAIKDSTIITPPKDVVLNGVVRQTVIHTALKNRFQLKEERIPLFSLSEFDGAFVTSTSSKIMPIKQVDDFTFAEIPQKLRELMKYYDTFLQESKGIFS